MSGPGWARQTGHALSLVFWIAASACSAQSLTIRVYDYTGLTSQETARATQVAGLILRRASLDVKWDHCRGALAAIEPGGCQNEMAGNVITIRLHGRNPNSSASATAELGQAFVAAAGGQYATVFVPAVRERSTEWEIAFCLILGHAIAHEAIHCLIGPEHSPSGLMRAPWTREDALEIAQQRLGLSKAEKRKLAARLVQPHTNRRN